jgi:DNA-binding IclR family transcriptional regulator
MERPNTDSFTAYLEAKQRLQVAAPESPAAAGPTALSLLFKLAEAGQMPLAELQAASGMPFTEFAAAVKDLSNSGYLTVSGAPGHEVAKLSPLGENVSRLARPVPLA